MRAAACIGCNGCRGRFVARRRPQRHGSGRPLPSRCRSRQRNLVGISAVRRAGSPPFARWPCSTRAKVRMRRTSKGALNYLRRLRPKTTYVVSLQTMVLCRATPVDDQDDHRPQCRMAGRDPGQGRPGRPQRRLVVWSSSIERSVDADGSNSQFALLALYEAARVAETGQIQRHHPPRDLGTHPHLLDQQPARGRRRLGLLKAHGRHRQHDLRGHCRAGHFRRRPPRARRQGVRRPDRWLLPGPLGRPGPDRQRRRVAEEALHRPGQSARHARRQPASGTTIISTGWSVPDDSPRGARSASTIGIAKGPTTWSRPSAPSSREVPGKAGPRRKQRRHRHQPGLAVPLQGTLARAHGQGAVRLAGRAAAARTFIGIATATTSTT